MAVGVRYERSIRLKRNMSYQLMKRVHGLGVEQTMQCFVLTMTCFSQCFGVLLKIVSEDSKSIVWIVSPFLMFLECKPLKYYNRFRSIFHANGAHFQTRFRDRLVQVVVRQNRPIRSFSQANSKAWVDIPFLPRTRNQNSQAVIRIHSNRNCFVAEGQLQLE